MNPYDLTTTEGRENFANKVDWEGGFGEAVLGYGLLPDAPPEVVARIQAWQKEGQAIMNELETMGALL